MKDLNNIFKVIWYAECRLYKKPRILFLDESTAHLDVNLEQVINSNIAQMQLTRIVISHRPETINFADRVILVTPEGCFEQEK